MKRKTHSTVDRLRFRLKKQVRVYRLFSRIGQEMTAKGLELMHEPGFPVLRVGNRMVVPKEKFIQWVEENTTGGTQS